jgi:hypothetical protein
MKSWGSFKSLRLVENQTRKKIKVLRFDNRGEYTFKEFDTFCREA